MGEDVKSSTMFTSFSNCLEVERSQLAGIAEMEAVRTRAGTMAGKLGALHRPRCSHSDLLTILLPPMYLSRVRPRARRSRKRVLRLKVER